MAWSTPRTWSTGDTLTAALMNTNSAQLTALHTGASGISSLTTGDVITAASSSQLTRQASLNVAQGGTGATTLTDGGVLLGSATSAVTAMAVLANSEMIVGNGTTDPVAETGATLRTSIGVGTGDSPQFTAIEVGAASDTTLARASAGNLTVEGNALYRAGGTDVAIADGGTGAGTAAAGFAALSPLTTRGDLLVASSGTVTGARLAVGGATEVLTSDGTDTAWAAAPGGSFSGVRLYKDADQTFTAGSWSTPVAITWQLESFDTDSFHDPGSNPERITIPADGAGKYSLYIQCYWSTTANAMDIFVIINGNSRTWNPDGLANTTSQMAVVLDLDNSDYVEIKASTNGTRVLGHSGTGNSGYSTPSYLEFYKL